VGEERGGEGERDDGGVVDVGGVERCAKGRGEAAAADGGGGRRGRACGADVGGGPTSK
jgi:hypothetical protein